ncbi:DgyrCDS5133 [Dimorphilus gyrociliatus]|uniref:Transporter n=1 Tax=Dimorphilus gyrociliatus TaxID=2664684 RepID=A0A7I8VKI4_9ANNE|nr:DgyrCDS5133 [Dimorphilus gyrociliatus]
MENGDEKAKVNSDIPSEEEDIAVRNRGVWRSKIDFFMALLGSSLCFGSVWRFGYNCYKNGGGAFIVPYFIFLVGAGIPTVFMEMLIGQYSSQGILSVWNVVPLFKGIGIGGVRVFGRIMCFTTSVIYISIFGFLIRILLFDGAEVGLKTFLRAEWSKIGTVSAWFDAAQQAIFTLGPCMGSMVTLSSHNRFTDNSYRVIGMMTICIVLTSFFTGVITFGLSGYLAHMRESPIALILSESDSSFVRIPEALYGISSSKFWLIFFYVNVFFNFFNGTSVLVHTVYTSIADELSFIQRRLRIAILATICFTAASLGCITITRQGSFMTAIMENYINGTSIALLGFLEVASISFFYGVNKLKSNRLKIALKPTKNWIPVWDISELLVGPMPDYIKSEQEELKFKLILPRRKSSLLSNSSESVSSVTSGLPPMRDDGQCGEDIDTWSVDWEDDENKRRGNWGGRWEFFLSGIGYCVGIGNVWRFPYLVYKNGGGAFLLTYVLILIFCGLPIFYMELILGQFSSLGPLTVWRFCPLFKGTGYATIITLTLVCIYYNVINAWSIFYLFASFTRGELPWRSCKNSFNSLNCVESLLTRKVCNQTFNDTSYPIDCFPYQNTTNSSIKFSTAAEEYFFRYVLNKSDGIEDVGSIEWRLALCLGFCWFLVALILLKGVKSAGKVVYVTVIFPLVILIIICIRFTTLGSDAYLKGLRYYITPKWERLSDAQVWSDAAAQLFLSLGLCIGGVMSMASYNRFHYDCLKDAYLICLLDLITSLFSGFVMFSILGIMAEKLSLPISEIITSKFSLIFIVCPEALSDLPSSNAWSALFYFMLICLAVDSQFLMVHSLATAVVDEFENLLRKRQVYVVMSICFILYLLGLPFCTRSGFYMVYLLDSYVVSWSVVLIGVITCIAVSWIYKMKLWSSNIRVMLGSEPSFFWKIQWWFTAPIILTTIMIFAWVKYEEPTVNAYSYPRWAIGISLLLGLQPMAVTVVGFFVQILGRSEGFKEGIRGALKPSSNWGPALAKFRQVCVLPSTNSTIDSLDRTAMWVKGISSVFVSEPLSNKVPDKSLHLNDSKQKGPLYDHLGNPLARSKNNSSASLLPRVVSFKINKQRLLPGKTSPSISTASDDGFTRVVFDLDSPIVTPRRVNSLRERSVRKERKRRRSRMRIIEENVKFARDKATQTENGAETSSISSRQSPEGSDTPTHPLNNYRVLEPRIRIIENGGFDNKAFQKDETPVETKL